MEDYAYPIGFRFYPTEQELISFYLHHQLQGHSQHPIHRVIPVLDIFETEPWNLPRYVGELCRGDTEQWFFFAPIQEREARGGRPCRSLPTGYWKVTGSPSYVYSSDNAVIGVKKSMVFYVGKPPAGRKTKWKLNEYKAIEFSPPNHNSSSSTTNVSRPKLRREFILCRVYVVSGTSRQFDRRPLEVMDRQTAGGAGGTGAGGGDDNGRATLSSREVGNELAGSSHEYEMASLEELPTWDWEQLNWLLQ